MKYRVSDFIVVAPNGADLGGRWLRMARRGRMFYPREVRRSRP